MIIIPNVLDFENPPDLDVKRTEAFRRSIALKTQDKIILQPTRIIRRKGIEQAINLVKELKDPRNKLIISHENGDEGFEYAEWLKEYALEQQVDLRMLPTKVMNPLTTVNHDKYYPYGISIHMPILSPTPAFMKDSAMLFLKRSTLKNHYW